MYGTVGYIRVKPGRQEELVSLLEEWRKERKPRVQGALEGYVFKMDADPQDGFWYRSSKTGSPTLATPTTRSSPGGSQGSWSTSRRSPAGTTEKRC